MLALGVAWLLSQLPNLAASIAIEVLKRTGVLTAAQIEVTDAGVAVLHAVGNIKIYSSPADFPNGPNNPFCKG